jgi:hypothetical protein
VTLLRALFDLAIALLLPGWLLLRAAGWPRSQPERLLLAGPTSIALIAVLTAVLGRFGGHPLTTAELVVVEAVLAGVVLLRVWRGAAGDEERLSWRWYVLGALPGLLLAGIAVAAVGGLVYPPAEDSIVHAEAVRWFFDGNAAPPYLVDHLRAAADPEIRFGFHAFAAALTRGTGLDPGKAVTAATWPVVLLMPGSLMLLARRAGMGWRGAFLSGAAALGIGIIPFKFLALGNVPLLAGAYVVAPCAAVAWCDALRVRSLGPVLVATVLVSGLIFVHPSDLPTLVLLTLVLLPIALRGFRRPNVAELTAVGIGALVVIALLRVSLAYTSHPVAGPVYGAPVGSAVQDDAFITHRHLSGFWDALSGTIASFPHDWVLPLLALAGVVLAWRRRPTQIFAVLGVLLLVIQIDAWGWQIPASVLTRVYPWPSQDRLFGLDWFVIPPLAALAILAIADRLRLRVAADDPGAVARTRMLVATAAAAAAVLPAVSFSPGMLEHAHDAQTGLTAADVAAFAQVQRAVPADSRVLTDGIADGGGWLSVIGGRETLLHKEWNHNTAAPEVRTALQELCAPGSAARLQALRVDWVYLGPDPATSAGFADRSCGATGSADLRSVPLDGATAKGPWLLHVEGATASSAP